MKGVALRELALLIVAVIVVVILLAIFFLFQMPLLIFPTVVFDHLSTLIRGAVISGIWALYWPIFGIIALIIWLDPSCWNPAGAVKCAAEQAIFSIALWAMMVAFMGMIPLAFMPVKLNNVGNSTFQTNFADWVMDTNIMFNGGDGDPLTGKGPNPRIGFIITTKKNRVYNLSQALMKLQEPYYSFYDKMKGKVWEDNRIEPGANGNPKFYSFKVDGKPFLLLIEKSRGSGITIYIWNSSDYSAGHGRGFCDFGGGSHSLSINKFPKDITNVNCGSENLDVSIDKSDLKGLYHIWIGHFTYRYKKLKSVVVRWKDSGGWHTCTVVDGGSWKGICNDLKSLDLSFKEIYLDFHDVQPFYSLGGTDDTDECGPKDGVSKEGVYICIPNAG